MRSTRTGILKECLVVLFVTALFATLREAPSWSAQAHAQPDQITRASLIRRLEANPADREALLRVLESSLDDDSSRKFELLQKAHRSAERLAPHSPAASESFLRTALFHWSELDQNQRREVKLAAGKLLGLRPYFVDLHMPFWALTKDFAWIREVAPRDLESTRELMQLALQTGRFDDYRSLRIEVHNTLEVTLNALERDRRPSGEIVALITKIDREKRNDGQFALACTALMSDPPMVSPLPPESIEPSIDYLIRNRIQPLDGLLLLDERSLSLPYRARLSLAAQEIESADRLFSSAAETRSPGWTSFHVERARLALHAKNYPEARAFLARIGIDATNRPEVVEVRQRVESAYGKRGIVAATYPDAPLPRTFTRYCTDTLCPSEAVWVRGPGPPEPLVLRSVSSDEIPPYVEVLINDVRVKEGPVRAAVQIVIPASTELRRIAVRLMNPITRNGFSRSLRID